jgi:hypothetical protein
LLRYHYDNMTSLRVLALSLVSLASIAHAAALPQDGTLTTISSPTAIVTIGGKSTTSTGMAIGVLVAMVVVLVAGCCGCGGLAWWLCARHKKRKAARLGKPTTPNSTNGSTQQPVPLTEVQQTNIVPPPGQYGQQDYSNQQQQGQQTGVYNRPDYFQQQQQPGYQSGIYDQTATPTSAYGQNAEPKFNPQTPNLAAATPISAPGTPAPPYSQPYQTQNHPPMPPPVHDVYEMDNTPASVAELG